MHHGMSPSIWGAGPVRRCFFGENSIVKSSYIAVPLTFVAGQATGPLGGPFRKVVAIDPSGPMLQAARANFMDSPCSATNFSFIQGNAANLDMLEDESVDLIISGIIHRSLLPFISDPIR